MRISAHPLVNLYEEGGVDGSTWPSLGFQDHVRPSGSNWMAHGNKRKVFSILNILNSNYELFTTSMLKPPMPFYVELMLLLQGYEMRINYTRPSIHSHMPSMDKIPTMDKARLNPSKANHIARSNPPSNGTQASSSHTKILVIQPMTIPQSWFFKF